MADTPPLASPQETADFRSAQVKEWTTWVAVQPITHNGALAYNPGDSVPAANVEKYGYATDGLVAKQGTKAANELISGLHASATDSTVQVVQPVSLGVAVPEKK